MQSSSAIREFAKTLVHKENLTYHQNIDVNVPFSNFYQKKI